MWFAILLAVALILGGCSPAPTPTATALPPTPTDVPIPTVDALADLDPVALRSPVTRVFRIDPDVSLMRYRGQGQGVLGVIQIPGEFKLAGQDVLLVPDGDGYRLQVVLIVDGLSATAPNGFLLGMLRRTLDVETYPTATFTGQTDATFRLDGGPVQLTASGELELRGRKRPLSLPLTLTLEGDVMRASGEVTLNLYDYEVNVPTAIMNSHIVFIAEISAREIGTIP